jgi:hypothetical protein
MIWVREMTMLKNTRTLKEAVEDNSALILPEDNIKITRPVNTNPVLGEGLRRSDLQNLVSDVISIDEYNSKIDDSAIVIAFHVQDRNAAQDLNRFIQKSFVDLLDTDVSPAPDQKGFYLVFIELPLNTSIGEAVYNITKDVGALADVEAWRMRLRTVKGTRPFNAKLVNRVLVKQLSNNVKEFFHTSDLNDVILEGSQLKMVGAGQVIGLPFVAYGPHERLFSQLNLTECAIPFNSNEKMMASRLQVLLGRNWDVEALEEHLVLRSYNSSQILLLRLL